MKPPGCQQPSIESPNPLEIKLGVENSATDRSLALQVILQGGMKGKHSTLRIPGIMTVPWPHALKPLAGAGWMVSVRQAQPRR